MITSRKQDAVGDGRLLPRLLQIRTVHVFMRHCPVSIATKPCHRLVTPCVSECTCSQAANSISQSIGCYSLLLACYGRPCHSFIRSPVLWTVDLMFCACFFFSQLTFSDVYKPIFSKLFHMTWLYSKKKRCYADFLKVPLNKNEGRKPPNFAQSRV